MKKTIIAFAAVAAAFCLASCSKSQTEPTANKIQFNITVADPSGSTDTRSVKSGWEAGDRLNLWFGEQRYSGESPQAYLEYDGSKWAIKGNVDTYRIEQEVGKGHNTFSVFYEDGNDLSRYFIDSYQIKPGNEMMIGSTYGFRMSLVCRNIPFELKDGILTANISGWKFATAVQITVTDVPAGYTAENTQLIDNTASPGWLNSLLWIENYDGRMKLAPGMGLAGAVAGREANSLVFHFMSTEALVKNASVILFLSNDESVTSRNFEKTFPEGLPAVTEDALMAISIPFSEFK